MVVQIYSITSVEQAVKCMELGVDHIGFVPNLEEPTQYDRWLIPFSIAKRIVKRIKSGAKSVALTFSNDVNKIIDLVSTVKPDFIHLSTIWDRLALKDLKELKMNIGKVKVMRTIAVKDELALQQAKQLNNSLVDVILLDTYSSNKGAASVDIGATGEKCNWEIAREIVKNVNIPVILAGGLNIKNVGEAIEQVKPWGVDSMTGTDVRGTSHMKKDYAAIKTFVRRAKKPKEQMF